MRVLIAALLLTGVASIGVAQDAPQAAPSLTPAAQAAVDAIVIDRIAEMSDRDFPSGLVRRIVETDIELLRGPRPDGTYEHATWQRFEASRVADAFTIQPRKDRMESATMTGANVYRILVGIPNRRFLVRRNRPVWIERVDVDYVGEGSPQPRQTSFEVKAWLQPGEIRPFDLPVIARQATVRVIATADQKNGYGNIDIALVQARIVDNADSPYAAAVDSAKAALRALDANDLAALRNAAQRMRNSLSGAIR